MNGLRRYGWATYCVLLTVQAVLSTILYLARTKGIPLPCGSFFGCATSIYRSPAILGLHLTDYAAIYSVGCLALVVVLAAAKLRCFPWLRVANGIGLAVSIASNSYNYIVNDALCPYCLSILALCLATFLLALSLDGDDFLALRQQVHALVTIGGLFATLAFVWFSHEIALTRRSGAIVGIASQDLALGAAIDFGNPSATTEVICFYGPTCQLCKDDIRRLRRLIGPESRLHVLLRARAVVGDQVTRRIAATLATIARQDPRRALDTFELDSDVMEPAIREVNPDPAAFDLVDREARLCDALDIHATPTFVLVTPQGARFLPSETLFAMATEAAQ